MQEIKDKILRKVIEAVARQRDNAVEGHKGATAEAAAHKGAMASRYDTFKEEAQYAAGGYAKQVMELDRVLAAFASLAATPPKIVHGSIYSLIEIRNLEDDSVTKYFLLPAGGGEVHEVDGERITILTVGSPLALALIGVRPGEKIQLEVDGTTKVFIVFSVS